MIKNRYDERCFMRNNDYKGVFIAFDGPNCNLRSLAVADAFQNGRCAEQNGRPKSLKITSC